MSLSDADIKVFRARTKVVAALKRRRELSKQCDEAYQQLERALTELQMAEMERSGATPPSDKD